MLIKYTKEKRKNEQQIYQKHMCLLCLCNAEAMQ